MKKWKLTVEKLTERSYCLASLRSLAELAHKAVFPSEETPCECLWLMPVILATWEAEIRRIVV
jgi:hypothetical protein